jgi:hypothetical protein
MTRRNIFPANGATPDLHRQLADLRRQLAEATHSKEQLNQALLWVVDQYHKGSKELIRECEQTRKILHDLRRQLTARTRERDAARCELVLRLVARNAKPRTRSKDAATRYLHDTKGMSYEKIRLTYPSLGYETSENVRAAVRRARERDRKRHP